VPAPGRVHMHSVHMHSVHMHAVHKHAVHTGRGSCREVHPFRRFLWPGVATTSPQNTHACANARRRLQVVRAIAAAGEVGMAREYAQAYGLTKVAGVDLSDAALAAEASRCDSGGASQCMHACA
jgi:hypothetical protein